jgi:hypothetical protein
MPTRQTVSASSGQSTKPDCLTTSALENAHNKRKQLSSASKTPAQCDRPLVATVPERREPTLEDLIADPSLSIWSKWV